MSVSIAQIGPQNLDFEDTIIGTHTPIHGQWITIGKNSSCKVTFVDGDSYKGQHAIHGRHALLLSKGPSYGDSACVIYQMFDAKPYRGKRVRYCVFDRRDSGSRGDGTIGLLVYKENEVLFYNPTIIPQVIPSEWKQLQMVVDIDTGATEIMIGCFVIDPCAVLFDNASFEIVGNDVEISSIMSPNKGKP
jgi:hypothetical protein